MENNRKTKIPIRVLDVNVLAIFLTKGHPGFRYVAPLVEAGLRGAYIPVIADFVPTRAFWIMTRPWKLPEKECAASIENFLKTYDAPRYACLERETILNAFKLAEELKHDVFDCTYLALALQERANGIITTDTDFEKLCIKKSLEYQNPVPKEILKQFKDQNA